MDNELKNDLRRISLEVKPGTGVSVTGPAVCQFYGRRRMAIVAQRHVDIRRNADVPRPVSTGTKIWGKGDIAVDGPAVYEYYVKNLGRGRKQRRLRVHCGEGVNVFRAKSVSINADDLNTS